jgi:hypothetical protein
MDTTQHYTIIILVLLELIIIPWAVYITVRQFNQSEAIAILKAKEDTIIRLERDFDKLEGDIKADIKGLTEKIDAMPLLIVKLLNSKI